MRYALLLGGEALGEQLFTMLSPCISGLARVPEARRLYKWREPGQLERFATLVRMAKATSPEERTELMTLKKQFDEADRQQRIVAMASGLPRGEGGWGLSELLSQ